MKNRNWITVVTSFPVDSFPAGRILRNGHATTISYAVQRGIVIQNRVHMDIIGIIYVLHSFFDRPFLSRDYSSVLRKIIRPALLDSHLHKLILCYAQYNFETKRCIYCSFCIDLYGFCIVHARSSSKRGVKKKEMDNKSRYVVEF